MHFIHFNKTITTLATDYTENKLKRSLDGFNS